MQSTDFVEQFRKDIRSLYAAGVSYAEIGRYLTSDGIGLVHRNKIQFWANGRGPRAVDVKFYREALDELLVMHDLKQSN